MVLKTRFLQFGGLRLIQEYAKLGILWPMIKSVLRNPLSKQSYKRAYNVALNKVRPLLIERYSPIMQERKAAYSIRQYEHQKSATVWFCWLQGLENAPDIVTVCFSSLQRFLPDHEIKIIDNNNWHDYVDLPAKIKKRWEKRQIPPANFSDLLRLELLIQYGGTWIDATVLCTGSGNTLEYLDTDLFMFQYTRPGSNQWGGIGNWFITACTNNKILMVLRDMLYAYWNDYDCTLDYYVFHLFFSMLREVYPEAIAAMPYGYASRHIALAKYLGKTFEQEKWDKLVSKVSFHKLTHVISESVKKNRANYYNHIIREYN